MTYCSAQAAVRNIFITTVRVFNNSKQSYKAFMSDSAPHFLSFCCFRAQKDEQVAMLLSVVDSLKEEINSVKVARDKHGGEPQAELPSNAYGDQSTSALSKGFAASVMTKNGESITHSVSRASQHQDSTFNVVLYGIDECPSGL